MESFSERLIHLRHSHNLTQKEVSDARARALKL